MNIDLQYRTTKYFNSIDYYIVETNLNKWLVTKLIPYNGMWFTVSGMEYKANSIRLINSKELGMITRVEGHDTRGNKCFGIITKFISPYFIGVNWEYNTGSKFMGHFWNNVNKIRWIG